MHEEMEERRGDYNIKIGSVKHEEKEHVGMGINRRIGSVRHEEKGRKTWDMAINIKIGECEA